MHMLTLYVHHLLRQLPYEIHFDSAMFTQCIAAKIQDSMFTSEPWMHAPAKILNKDYLPEPSAASPDRDHITYPVSSQFPTRQAIIDKFVNNLYIPWARVIPHMAIEGIVDRMPIVLRPTDPKDKLNILRPTTSKQLFNFIIFYLISSIEETKTTTQVGPGIKKSKCLSLVLFNIANTVNGRTGEETPRHHVIKHSRAFQTDGQEES